MAKLEELKCKECGGIMNTESKAKHNQLWAFVVIGIAIVVGFTGIGLIIGIPLGLYGLYLAAVIQKHSLCRNCRAMLQHEHKKLYPRARDSH